MLSNGLNGGDLSEYFEQGVVRLSRSTTVASNASTIKEHDHHDDDLLAAVFSAVVLPDVSYEKAPVEPHHHHHHHHNDSVSIQPSAPPLSQPASVRHSSSSDFQHKELDSVLATMDMHLDEEQSQSYRSSISSLAASSVAQQVVEVSISEHAEFHRQQSHDSQHSGHNHHHHHHHHDHKTVEEEEEEHDHVGLLPDFETRKRSQTIDSMVSVAESRFGGFDVNDEEGNFTAQEINLQHNEVAYRRYKAPKKVTITPSNSYNDFTVDDRNLVEINKQLIEAQRKKLEELSHQIQRESPPTAQKYAPKPVVRNSIERYSNDSFDGIYEEKVSVSDVAAHQIHHGREIRHENGKAIIIPELREVGKYHQRNIRKFIVGGDQHPTPEDKTVLLFGPVGSGKTSIVNSILNYLFDVKRENDFRFVINEAEQKTTGLTAYVITHSILPYSVTIVDTPGVPNTRGDTTVSSLVHNWFEQDLHSAGEFRLDAVSIVLRHNESQLDWTFINELAVVKRIFGDDLKSNVLPIITNSEVLPQPAAIRSLTHANIPFVEYYKVNNSGFFPTPPTGLTKLKHNLFFKHGIASLESYFKDLQEHIHPLLAVLRAARKPHSASVTNSNHNNH